MLIKGPEPAGEYLGGNQETAFNRPSPEFDEWVKSKIINRDFSSLYMKATKTEAGQMSLPTPDHYAPLLYVLGATDIEEDISFVYEGFQNASISMRSLRIG